MMQKVIYGLAKMYMEDDVEGNTEFGEMLLVANAENVCPSVPDLEVSENRIKQKCQEKKTMIFV